MTEVKIELLSRYPFQEPSATITTPVYHPNVYSSGKICFGAKWMPTQGLDLLVRRIIQIITFDKDILNEKSPANAQALHWYRDLIRSNPSAFPTERLIFRENSRNQMRWTNKDACEDQKVLVSCDNCKASLRVPKDKHINVTCPKCNYKFFVKT
jgi:DNA-directed RNA polymerase subunit RPC12/RpoP